MYIYINMYMYIHMFKYVYIYIHMCVNICIYMYIYQLYIHHKSHELLMNPPEFHPQQLSSHLYGAQHSEVAAAPFPGFPSGWGPMGHGLVPHFWRLAQAGDGSHLPIGKP